MFRQAVKKLGIYHNVKIRSVNSLNTCVLCAIFKSSYEGISFRNNAFVYISFRNVGHYQKC